MSHRETHYEITAYSKIYRTSYQYRAYINGDFRVKQMLFSSFSQLLKIANSEYYCLYTSNDSLYN